MKKIYNIKKDGIGKHQWWSLFNKNNQSIDFFAAGEGGLTKNELIKMLLERKFILTKKALRCLK